MWACLLKSSSSGAEPTLGRYQQENVLVAQGNAAHLLNQNGTVVAHLAYDAWGQPMSGNNPTPYGYKGQWGYYTDGETGLLLLTHRYFDPATGRFLTRDRIGFNGRINLYAYVGNGVVMAWMRWNGGCC
jgi:RHS repeat-associated protein